HEAQVGPGAGEQEQPVGHAYRGQPGQLGLGPVGDPLVAGPLPGPVAPDELLVERRLAAVGGPVPAGGDRGRGGRVGPRRVQPVSTSGRPGWAARLTYRSPGSSWFTSGRTGMPNDDVITSP